MASLLLIIPSIYLASKKWERETLKRNSNNYLEAIHRQYPELVIIQHEVFQSEGKNYMSLSVLNDSATLSSDVIKETQSLNKDIEIQWHFAPNNTLNEIKLLQRRMDNLGYFLTADDYFFLAMTLPLALQCANTLSSISFACAASAMVLPSRLKVQCKIVRQRLPWQMPNW